MTERQKIVVRELLEELMPSEVHHGVCVGADEDFHWLVRQVCPEAKIHGHPGVNARGDSPSRSRSCEEDCDVWHPEKQYLSRNVTIVQSAVVVIATPATAHEMRRGSGTWHAIRIARSRGKSRYVVRPDGKLAQ